VPQNPFFEDWSTPFGLPPFDQIRVEHFQPAYDKALPQHVAKASV
jgi:peptidyl-dipeptidase Dcp